MLICFCGHGYDSRPRRVRGCKGTTGEHDPGVVVIAVIAFAVWLYLLTAHGAFWRCTERDDWEPVPLDQWPRVAAVVPARNEADGIAASIGALLRQDYAGPWTVILVDDDSNDGTAEVARRAAAGSAQLHVVTGCSLPAGWTGKLWAVKQGIDAAIS